MGVFALHAGFSDGLEESLIIAFKHDAHACIDDLGGAAEFPNGAAIFIHQSGFLRAFREALIFHLLHELDREGEFTFHQLSLSRYPDRAKGVRADKCLSELGAISARASLAGYGLRRIAADASGGKAGGAR
jgi:hypothetical protein